jgi:hypothetical protein
VDGERCPNEPTWLIQINHREYEVCSSCLAIADRDLDVKFKTSLTDDFGLRIGLSSVFDPGQDSDPFIELTRQAKAILAKKKSKVLDRIKSERNTTMSKVVKQLRSR